MAINYRELQIFLLTFVQIRPGHSSVTRFLIWLSACLEIAKQAVQALLVVIMLFPVGEISNMPRSSDISSPRQVGLHHGLIKLDREENKLLLRMSLF